MHGPLSEIGLIEVLQLLERGGRSGVLSISGAHPAEPCQLHIREGEVVALEPAAGDAATVRALVARHLISDLEAEDDPGVVARPMAVQMRTQLAAQALGEMLHWRRGRFDFVAAAVGPGPLSLSPDALVFDLVASESQRVEFAPLMQDFLAIPAFVAPDIIAVGDAPAITPREWRLLDQIDGVRDVATLAVALDERVDEVAASIQSLQGALILELRRPAADAGQSVYSAIDAGRYEEATRLLRERLAEYPDDVEAWRALGLAEVGAGRFDAAIDAWQSWRTNDPAHAGDAAALMQAARTMVEAMRDARD